MEKLQGPGKDSVDGAWHQVQSTRAPKNVNPLPGVKITIGSSQAKSGRVWIMGSSFIHLIRTDSNEFFLMAE